MNLDEIVNRFGQLQGAEVGCGYQHPTSPNPDLKVMTEDFIDQYPYLQQDPDYITFLRRYAGLVLTHKDDLEWYGLVYGFHFDWMPFVDLDEAHRFPDFDGFFIFCETSIIRSAVSAHGAHYAFDSTGNLKPGVYKRVRWEDVDPSEITYEWHCESFLEWLNDFVEKEGIVL